MISEEHSRGQRRGHTERLERRLDLVLAFHRDKLRIRERLKQSLLRSVASDLSADRDNVLEGYRL